MKEQYKKGKKNFKKPYKGGDTSAAQVVSGEYAKHEPVQAKPLEVKVYGNFDKAFKAFRSIVQKERVLSVYKEKQSYEKRSDKRRRKVNESKRKQLEFCSKGECLHQEHSKK